MCYIPCICDRILNHVNLYSTPSISLWSDLCNVLLCCRCIPCPKGTYVDTNTTLCANCPPDTVIRGINPWGAESCVKCGEGLEPYMQTTCVTKCSYKSGNNSYDFLPLSGYGFSSCELILLLSACNSE